LVYNISSIVFLLSKINTKQEQIGGDLMKEQTFRVYGYRWVVLAVFMFINLIMQMLWITFASIIVPAAKFYGVSELQIGFLAMTFMIAFIPLSIPVSWVIDTYGFRLAVSIGAVLMGVFAIARGLAGANYTLVLVSTIGLGIAQPFLMNSWTKVPANWFSINERATAVGLVTLANLLGVALGQVLTPILTEQLPIPTVQLIYGGVAAIAAVLFVALSREHPLTPPCPPGMEARSLMLDGLKQILRSVPFWLFVIVYFVGMGIFNGISNWVGIIRPTGFTPTELGLLGGLMVLGGIIGAVVIPSLSDKQHKRQRFMLLGVLLAIPGLIGVTFANVYWLLLVSFFFLGFFLISVAPIGLQYVAEITYPAPEGTSAGLIQLFGQLSVVFVYVMEAMRSKDGAFTPSLLLATVLLVVLAGVITQMKDPPTRNL
jgi:MFS family permease